MSSESESTTSNTFSSPNLEFDGKEDDDEWDEEEVDEEITELREVLERSKYTISYLEESGDSLDQEDNEMIKAKLRALRGYVKDLQASYDELLHTFRLLEDAAKQKVTTMEGKLAAALDCAKDFQSRCNSLEYQLRDLRENSFENLSHRHGNHMVDKEAQSQMAALEEDLSSVMRAITEGVESGVIKLSGLQLLTQEVPLPLQDVVVGGAPLAPPTTDHMTSSRPHPLNEGMSPVTRGVQFNEHNEIMGGVNTGGVSGTTHPHSPSAHSSHVTSDHVISTLAYNKDTPTKRTEYVHRDTPTHIDTPTKRDTSIRRDTPTTTPTKRDTPISLNTHVTRDQGSISPNVSIASIQTDVSLTAKLENTPPPNVSMTTTHCDSPPNMPFGTKTPPPNVSMTTSPFNGKTPPPHFNGKTPPPNVSMATSPFNGKTPPPNVSMATMSPSLQSNDITWDDDDSLIKTDQSNDLTGNEDDSLEDEDVIAQMILEKDCRIAELETSVNNLQYQLQEFQHLHESTKQSLNDTEGLLLRQRVNKEGDLSQVMSQISAYQSERDKMAAIVEEERKRVRELEGQRDGTAAELNRLREQVNSLSTIATCGSEDDTERSSLEGEVGVSLDETLLDQQRASLQRECEEAGQRVELLHSSFKAAKREAQELQAVSARKESELTRVTSAIHTTRAKLAALHQVERDMVTNGNGTSNEDCIKGLEWDLATVKEKWEELCSDLSNHEAAIASLTGRELTLQGELDRQGARVIELETCVQAGEVGAGINKKSVSSLQTALGLLKSQLEETKRDHLCANEQVKELYHVMESSVMSIVEQLQLLRGQVIARDQRIADLETERQQLWELYQLNNDKIKDEQARNIAREEAVAVARDDLLVARQQVEELEQSLASNQELRDRDLEYQEAVVMDTVTQLRQLTDNITPRELVMVDTAGVLQSQVARRDLLLQTLQEQTAILLRQQERVTQQTEERREMVCDLESKLLSTHTLCDALEQEVADGHKKLVKVQRQLVESEREREQLRSELERLQCEAEEACTSLESALDKNALLQQQNHEGAESLDQQRRAHSLLRQQSESHLTQLTEELAERDEEVSALSSALQRLERENARVTHDNLQHHALINKLKEELDLNGTDVLSFQRELTERAVAMDTLRTHLLEAESDKTLAEAIATERLGEVTSLQQCNQELMTVNDQLKQKLSADNSPSHRQQVEALNEEVETVKRLYDSKSVELERVKYSYQLSLKKENEIISQLEECRRELAVCKKRADELDSRYQSTLCDLSRSQTELDSLRVLSEPPLSSDSHSRDQLRSKVKKLERQLSEERINCGQLHEDMSAAASEKRKLLHKLGALEEHYHSLIRTSSQQKLDLERSRRKGEEHRKQCLSMKGEHDYMADQVSEWAESTKTTTDALIQKIRDQDNEISRLKAHQEQILTDNRQLRDQLNVTLTEDVGGASGGGVLSLSELPQLSMQYQQILEKGLCSSSALDTSGYSSPTESTAEDLDKSYWIKRAGELSLQLQQSSQYWSNKVREQSLKIHKYESK